MSAGFQIGQKLPDLVVAPSALQLFRYSAVTWNAHRVHYDEAWAKHEGHEGLLVHSHLHAANALRAATDGLGPDWRIAHVSYRIVRPSTAGRTLRATAQVSSVSDDGRELELRLVEYDDGDRPCLEGTARAVRQ